MNFIKRKLALGILSLALLTPAPKKAKSMESHILGALMITIFSLEIYMLWSALNGDSEEKNLTNNIKKNPNIPAHIKRKILEKTSGWGMNKKTYLRFANALPWVNVRPKFVSYEQAEKTLNATHYGLDNAKKRILEYLVAYQSNPHAKGKVLCLIGGPGVGKTSLVKSIAQALERPFALVSTATQEWTLRGHEYTFISAEPGDFSKALCSTQSQHPIILLDEIDKATNNTQALLEALDPERNSAFLDTFLDFGINLSNVLFIATANNIERIPQPLRDRMELIQLEAYSFEDKVNIACKYFIPQLTKHANLPPECIQQLCDCVPQIIKFTSRTSDGADGVRSLRHAIDGLINKQIFNQTVYGKTLDFTPENIKEYIDPYYTQLRLSEPKDLRTYCNNALRKLDIPLDLFIKIERRIGGLFNWIASSTLVPAYIDWISKYPFATTMAPEVSLESAAEQLDATHYGLSHVKESVLDYLAGYAASKKKTTKILCFAGAPGVGKTTIAESISLALGRKFTKISFTPSTNLTSTSEHGTIPGELGHAIIKAQSSNPVILLDELEKAHPSMQKELLALLDPAQNGAINDDYLGFEMDLSNVMFIASVNDVEMLPAPLRDRMQIIELDPYSREERIIIANNKLIPDIGRLMNSSPAGIEKMLSFVEPLVDKLMDFEAGVRALKRSLAIAAEKIARLEQKGVDVTTAELKIEDVIDPYFRSNRLSDPKKPYSYCNQLFKHMFIPPAIFKKIDQKIAGMTLWAGAESMIPLYAETITKYPFGKMDATTATLESAKTQLDKTHSGLKKIKEMILDFLAGYIVSNQKSTKVLCLAGAPGVGKTTVAESIATALGRKFSKISFGGINSLSSQGSGGHDELSGPGPIAKALIETGSLNPVILLDELEKAPQHLLPQLLEILDPAQNKAFTDRYLGFEMDLSKVMFIASVNDAGALASPLLNRMQMVVLPPYKKAERITIAREKLLPAITQLFNLSPEVVQKIDALIEPLANVLLRTEHGVRNMNKALVTAAEKYVRNNNSETLTLNGVIASLNPEFLQIDPSNVPAKEPTVGLANGMYANGADGGGILKIIANIIPNGEGKLSLPGLHGKMSKEAYKRIVNYVKINAAKYGVRPEMLTKNDFTISDQGYESVEGPSAGIVTTVAFISALTNRPVRQDVATTGAMDMLGNAIAVGGYRDKVLGSARHGIKKFILPECARPIIESQKDEFEGLEITFISHVDEAVNLLLI